MKSAVALVRDRADSIQIPANLFEVSTTSWEHFTSSWLLTRNVGAVLAAPRRTQITADLMRIQECCAGHPVLLLMPSDSSPDEIRAAAGVCDDFLVRPVREIELQARASRILTPAPHWRPAVPSHALEALWREFSGGLLGNAPGFTEQMRRLRAIATTAAPVLITGETGTGKELCARALHGLSPRRDNPMIVVDCGSVPDHLLDNELFGHVRGAYTDAHANQKGLIALADGGTLFIDEIDALSIPAQAKLLRFLEDHTFRPLGSDRFSRSEVRVIVASNKDLDEWSAAGQFRSDLFHRLNVLRLQLPPLRERAQDIILLAEHFLQEAARETGLPPRRLSSGASAHLFGYNWPGNVRELRNAMYRATVLADGTEIGTSDLPGAARDVERNESSSDDFRSARSRAIEQFEKTYVSRLLLEHGGNITRAAKEAGKERRAFGRLVKKHHLKGA